MGSSTAEQQHAAAPHTEQGQQQQQQHQPDFLAVVQGKITELETSTLGSSSSSHAERESAKQRKRTLKEMEKFLENKSHSSEDRVNFLQAKYTQLITDLYRVEKGFHESQTKLENMQKEKDKVQLELKKSNNVRDKLEELCRQLQRDNRDTLEIARKLKEEEAQSRQTLQTKFSATINEVSAKMESQQVDREKQLKESEALHTKLYEVMASTEACQKLIHTKDLEVQLANAKLKQQESVNEQLSKKNDLYQQAYEQMEKTHKSIAAELEELVVLKQQNVLLQETNNKLKSQVGEYAKEFSKVQSTVAKSNKVFDQFKKSKELQDKQTSQLLQDCQTWKSKCVQSEAQVEKLQGQLTLSSVDPDEVKRLRTQKEALEGLCRSLQAQVKASKPGDAQETQPPPQVAEGAEA